MARDSDKKKKAAEKETSRIYLIALAIINAIFVGGWWFFEVDFGYWSYAGFVVMAVGYWLSLRGIVAAAESPSAGGSKSASVSAFDEANATSEETNERFLKFSWNDLFYVTALCQGILLVSPFWGWVIYLFGALGGGGFVTALWMYDMYKGVSRLVPTMMPDAGGADDGDEKDDGGNDEFSKEKREAKKKRRQELAAKRQRGVRQ